jgi:hypothetical protein
MFESFLYLFMGEERRPNKNVVFAVAVYIRHRYGTAEKFAHLGTWKLDGSPCLIYKFREKVEI